MQLNGDALRCRYMRFKITINAAKINEILIDAANEWGRGSIISSGGVSTTTISIVVSRNNIRGVEIVLGERCNSCKE